MIPVTYVAIIILIHLSYLFNTIGGINYYRYITMLNIAVGIPGVIYHSTHSINNNMPMEFLFWGVLLFGIVYTWC